MRQLFKSMAAGMLMTVFTAAGVNDNKLMAQDTKRANVWAFGKGASLDFNFTPPKANTFQTNMHSNEGASSLCDTNGNLLAYSDGLEVYNRYGDTMKNGTDLIGDNSSTQASLLVPMPGMIPLYTCLQ